MFADAVLHPSIFGVRMKARRASVPQHGNPSLDCWPSRLTVMSISIAGDVRRLGSTLPLNRRLLVLVQYQTTTKCFGVVAILQAQDQRSNKKSVFVRPVSVQTWRRCMTRQHCKTRHSLSPNGPARTQKSKPVIALTVPEVDGTMSVKKTSLQAAAKHQPGILNQGLELRRYGS
jgi:hypothetical protein